MSAFAVVLATEYTVVTCCRKGCGITFALPDFYVERRRLDHAWFYCPNGHEQYFPGKSDVEKLRDQLAAEKHKAEQAQADASAARRRVDEVWEEKKSVERRLSATKGVVTRHKRKIARGRCVCCSKQFKDLETHMRVEHPNWNPDKEVEARCKP